MELLGAASCCGRPLQPAFRSGVLRTCNAAASEGARRVQVPQLVEEAFAELNSELLRTKVKGVRRRQHCNPLKAPLMEPIRVADWKNYFVDPALPLMVDVGSGQGRFTLLLAKQNAGTANCLGLEVRDGLVEKCNIWAKELQLSNMCFMTANATVSFDSLLSTYPGKLILVCILCPDPHFKRRHHKRRIVQPVLVDAIIRHMSATGKILLETDVVDVAVEMRNLFEQKLGVSIVNAAAECGRDSDGWLLDNPLGIRTEREIAVLASGRTMYRMLYKRL